MNLVTGAAISGILYAGGRIYDRARSSRSSSRRREDSRNGSRHSSRPRPLARHSDDSQSEDEDTQVPSSQPHHTQTPPHTTRPQFNPPQVYPQGHPQLPPDAAQSTYTQRPKPEPPRHGLSRRHTEYTPTSRLQTPARHQSIRQHSNYVPKPLALPPPPPVQPLPHSPLRPTTSPQYPLYPYARLERTRAIRLIELHPSGRRDAPLRCSFFHDALPEKITQPLSYEAVSYAWGKPELSSIVLCDNAPSFIRGRGDRTGPRERWQLWITEGLDSALRALRLASQPRVLWVDAICINQADTREKIHQVRQMRDLYQGARQVLVWLGDDFHGGGQTLHWLEEMGKWRLQFGDAPVDEAAYKDISESLHIGLPVLQEFFSRVWFQRRWVIHEVTHARQAKLCCGTVQCDWSEFAAGVHCLYDVNSQESLFRGKPLEVIQGLRLIDIMKRRPELMEGFDLCDAVNLFYDSDTSEDHDRILALLSFTQHPERYIDPESIERDYYRLPPLDFYVQFAGNALSRSHNLDILHLAGAFRTVDKSTRAPSWCPDFRSSPRHKPLLNVHRFSAGIGQAPDACNPPRISFFGPQASSLLLGGYLFGRIVARSDPISKSATYEQIRQLIPQYRRISHCSFEDDIGTRHALATTLIADQALSDPFLWTREPMDTPLRVKRTQKLEIGFLQLCHSATPFDPSPPARSSTSDSLQSILDNPKSMKYAQRYAELVSTTMSGRCLFRVESGHIGIGPDDACPGDIVVIFAGGRTPFALRPKERRSFALLGDCYIDGVMHGETLGQNHWTQFEIV